MTTPDPALTPDEFRQQLQIRTESQRDFLLQSPLIQAALEGQISRGLYVAFLTQAWHHVRQTVPLLMALGGHLPDRLAHFRPQVADYVNEEMGHDEWILADIAAAGGDRQAVLASLPDVATDAMIGYAWDVVLRRNPVGLFGMVHVLEGTSVALAVRAADAIQRSLGLPDQAFTYLRSHGALDVEHVQHLAGILASLREPEDQQAVIQGARTVYWLYGHMFRGLVAAAVPGQSPLAVAAAGRRRA